MVCFAAGLSVVLGRLPSLVSFSSPLRHAFIHPILCPSVCASVRRSAEVGGGANGWVGGWVGFAFYLSKLGNRGGGHLLGELCWTDFVERDTYSVDDNHSSIEEESFISASFELIHCRED